MPKVVLMYVLFIYLLFIMCYVYVVRISSRLYFICMWYVHVVKICSMNFHVHDLTTVDLVFHIAVFCCFPCALSILVWIYNFGHMASLSNTSVNDLGFL